MIWFSSIFGLDHIVVLILTIDERLFMMKNINKLELMEITGGACICFNWGHSRIVGHSENYDTMKECINFCCANNENNEVLTVWKGFGAGALSDCFQGPINSFIPITNSMYDKIATLPNSCNANVADLYKN